MGLHRLDGTISRLGQCEFDNNIVVYAYIEFIDDKGLRTLVKKVAVCVDIEAAIGEGIAGLFYMDEVFVWGRRYRHQLWGLKTDQRIVVDGMNLRSQLARENVANGMLFTPLFGLGLPQLAAGIGQTWSLISGSANRRKYFARSEPKAGDRQRFGGIAETPSRQLPLPERLGFRLREVAADLYRKRRLLPSKR